MIMSRKLKRALPALALMVVGGISACDDDPLSGPATLVGDVLLDLSVTPAAVTVAPNGAVAISAGNRDTLTVTLNNLMPLPAGSSYQVLLAADSAARLGTDAGVAVLRPVSGRIIRQVRSYRPVNRDSTFVSRVTDTTASAPLVLSNSDTNMTYTLRIIGVPQGDSVKKFTHVVVRVTTAPLTAPEAISGTQRVGFMWAMFRDTKGTAVTTDDTFAGAFAVFSGSRYRFAPGGAITAAIRGDEIRINYRLLPRPPEGFRYASWLIDARTGQHVRIGELRTPEPGSVSLNDADVGTPGERSYLTRDGILFAEVRGNAQTLGIKFDDFTRYALVLEAKGAAPARAPGWEILVGAIPQSVASRHPAAGKLTGTVTSTSGSAVTGTTIYLTGVNLPNPLLVTSADAAGKFRFNTVNVGSYTLHAIPAGQTTVVTTLPVTLGTTVTGTTTKGDSVHVNVTIP
jgi:hypothetical protein